MVEDGMEYTVKIISPEEKDFMFTQLVEKVRFERKANLHGACVKLLTNNPEFKEEWEDNFKFMNEDIRPHAKIFAIEEDGQLQVMYEPISRSCLVLNCDYYGWVKSLALAAVSDFFEDYHSEHRRYSVHGSAVDYGGHSIAIIGPPGTGKTTLTYGLLQEADFNYISDDWFFIRIFSNAMVLYSSEKNSYIRDDLAQVWEKFRDKVMEVQLDNRHRGVADVQTLFDGRVRESSNLKTVILLERVDGHPPIREVKTEEALKFMIDKDFCNPHQLVRNKRKENLRTEFFKELFSKVDVYILNTVETPQESLDRIKTLARK
jgi:adenylate kinase family enzyme